jgi:hypothetical protein
LRTNVATAFYPSHFVQDENNILGSYKHFVVALLRAYYAINYDLNFINYEKEDNNFYYFKKNSKEDYKIPFSSSNKEVLINYIPIPEDKVSYFPTYSFLDIVE